MSSIEEYKLFLGMECERKTKEMLVKIKMLKPGDPARNDAFKLGIVHDLNIIDAEMADFIIEFEADKTFKLGKRKKIRKLYQEQDFLRETIAKISLIDFQENFDEAKRKAAKLVLDAVLLLKNQEKLLS